MSIVVPGSPRIRTLGERRLVSRATAQLALLAVVVPVAIWLIAAALAPTLLYNDFHSYWYAGRLLAGGSSPYDLDAIRALAAQEGDVFSVGTGFSYPLPFAMAMVPLSTLPFNPAVALFNAISLAVFAAAVAVWLHRYHATASMARLRVATVLAGAFPPLVGSVLNGQANLVVTAALGAGIALVLEQSAVRSVLGGVVVGLATVVKLVPGALALPLWLSGRRHLAVGVVAGFGIPLGLAAVALPNAALDSGKLVALFRPDPYFTNQSLNGFVSRLVEGTDRITALAPGAFDPAPVVAILTIGFAGATAGILWRARERLRTTDGLAVALALTLVGATAGAPKTSFWNTALLLVAVGLLLHAAALDLNLGAFDRVERRLLLAWLATAFLQPLVWIIAPMSPGPVAGVVAILGSLSLYGTLGLWWLLGRRLLRSGTAGYVAVRGSASGRAQRTSRG